jgi:hypothetical protein
MSFGNPKAETALWIAGALPHNPSLEKRPLIYIGMRICPFGEELSPHPPEIITCKEESSQTTNLEIFQGKHHPPTSYTRSPKKSGWQIPLFHQKRNLKRPLLTKLRRSLQPENW